MRKVLALVVASTALASACGDGNDDAGGGTSSNGVQPPAAQSTTSAKLPYAGAPKVQTPLQGTESLQQKPCNILSDGDVKAAGMSGISPKSYKGHEGQRCQWTTSDIGLQIMWNTSGTGLSGTYADKGNFVGFKAIAPIDGFPTVQGGDPSDPKTCTVTSGIADNLSIAVSGTMSKPGLASACKATGQVQKLVLDELRKKSQ